MTVERERCNGELLSRYLDRETTPEETQHVDRHLKQCPACRQHLQQHGELARRLRREVSAAGEAADFDRLEMHIIRAARRPKSPWIDLRRTRFSWKLLVPIAATAAVALFFFTSVFQPPAPAGPSAIINSFTGRVSSVMILETPQSRHTVIWYSEETMEANGADSKKL